MINIEERLRFYKKMKAEVETTIQRIAAWREVLIKGELWRFIDSPASTLGMPRAPMSSASPVERLVIKSLVSEDQVKQWISDDESRVFLKKLECDQIELAYKCLSGEQRFIIDLKYFQKTWTWREIERNFNDTFCKHREYISSDGLRRYNKDALRILKDILDPFYSHFGL